MSVHGRFIADRRDAAAKAGRPLIRSAFPVTPASSTVVWLADGVPQGLGRDGNATDVDARWLEQMSTDGQRVVFADQATFRFVIRMLDRQGTPAARRCAARFRTGSRLAVSSRFGVLTSMLDSRWWMPAGRNTTDLGAWASAFGLTRGPHGLRELLSRVTDGWETAGGLAWPEGAKVALRDARRNESIVLDKVGTRDPNRAIDSFLAAEALSGFVTHFRVLDPVARHEVVSVGDAVRITPIGRTSGSNVLATMSQPCRLREGDVGGWSVAGGGKEFNARLVAISFDASMGLVGEFGPRSTKSNKFGPLERASRSGEQFVVAPEPFLGVGGKTFGRSGRWTNDAAAHKKVEGREVPLDVILAGGTER